MQKGLVLEFGAFCFSFDEHHIRVSNRSCRFATPARKQRELWLTPKTDRKSTALNARDPAAACVGAVPTASLQRIFTTSAAIRIGIASRVRYSELNCLATATSTYLQLGHWRSHQQQQQRNLFYVSSTSQLNLLYSLQTKAKHASGSDSDDDRPLKPPRKEKVDS